MWGQGPARSSNCRHSLREEKMKVSRRAFIGGIGVLGLSLVGCGSGNVVAETTGSPDATTVAGTPSEKPAQPRVTESCVTTAMGYSFWTAIVENPNSSYAATNVKVKATLYDDGGAILGTGQDYATLLLPGHKVAFTQQTSEFEASRVEVEVSELDDDDFAAWDLESDGDPQFEVTDLNEVEDDYSTNVSGNVMNDFTKKTEICVVVCMRDASGALVDGAEAYVTDVPANDATSFTAYLPRKAVDHATLEGYSNPSVPMS